MQPNFSDEEIWTELLPELHVSENAKELDTMHWSTGAKASGCQWFFLGLSKKLKKEPSRTEKCRFLFGFSFKDIYPKFFLPNPFFNFF